MRDLKTKLPSPSEHASFVHCPTAWWLRYRAGIRKVESAARLASGEAVSWGLCSFYHGEDALATYDKWMGEAAARVGTVNEEEWQVQIGLDRAALANYCATQEKIEDGWEGMLDCQGRIQEEVNLVPDMVVKLRDGYVLPREFKVISPWADLEYEKKMYEMGMQPIAYAKMVEVKYQAPCKACEMIWLVRPKPAKGKYKEEPPKVEKHMVMVEPWKKRMWEASANFANAAMEFVDHLAGEEGVELAEIPKFTHNCVKKLGSMTFMCDYYPACSENMHPLQVVGGFEQRKEEGK